MSHSIPASPSPAQKGSSLAEGAAQAFVNTTKKTRAVAEGRMRSFASEKRPNLTYGAVGTEDVQADASWAARMPADYPSMPFDSPAIQLAGVTTGINAFQGGFACHQAAKRYKEAARIGDTAGQIESMIDGARGVAQSVGGAAYMAYRVEQTAFLLQSAHGSSALGLKAAAGGFGCAGAGAFIAFFALIAGWAGFKWAKDAQFLRAYQKAKDEGFEALFAFLTKRVAINSKNELGKYSCESLRKTGNEKTKFRKTIRKQGLDALVEIHKKLHPQEQKTSEEIQEEMGRSGSENSPAYKELLAALGLQKATMYDGNGDSLLSLPELLGFFISEQLRQERKEAKFTRLTNGASVQAIKKAAARGLHGRLTNPNQVIKDIATRDLKVLSAEVEKTSKTHRSMHRWVFVIGVIGIIAMVAGLFTVGWPLWLAFAAGVVVALLMLWIDYKYTRGALDAPGKIGKYDQLFVVAVGVVAVASLVLSAGLMVPLVVAGVMGMNYLLPLIITALITLSGVGISARAYKRLGEKEAQYQADHPSLDKVIGVFEKHANTLRVTSQEIVDREALFKKLSKPERLRIRQKYREIKTGELQDLSACETKLNDFSKCSSGPDRNMIIRALKKSWKAYALNSEKRTSRAAFLLRVLLDATSSDHGTADRAYSDALIELKRIDVEAFNRLLENMDYIEGRKTSDVFYTIMQASKSATPLAEVIEAYTVGSNSERRQQERESLYQALPEETRNSIRAAYEIQMQGAPVGKRRKSLESEYGCLLEAQSLDSAQEQNVKSALANSVKTYEGNKDSIQGLQKAFQNERFTTPDRYDRALRILQRDTNAYQHVLKEIRYISARKERSAEFVKALESMKRYTFAVQQSETNVIQTEIDLYTPDSNLHQTRLDIERLGPSVYVQGECLKSGLQIDRELQATERFLERYRKILSSQGVSDEDITRLEWCLNQRFVLSSQMELQSFLQQRFQGRFFASAVSQNEKNESINLSVQEGVVSIKDTVIYQMGIETSDIGSYAPLCRIQLTKTVQNHKNGRAIFEVSFLAEPGEKTPEQKAAIAELKMAFEESL